MNLSQFDIVYAQLDPTQGREQKGFRPVVVLQSSANQSANTFLIAPLTTQKCEKVYPYEILIQPSAENQLKHLSKLKLDQIRVLDVSRLSKPSGFIETSYWDLIFEGLDVIFDRHSDFR